MPKPTKNTFEQDLKSPLPEVQRSWIRKPVTILMTIIALPFSIIYAIWNAILDLKDFFLECWRGQ